MHSGRLEQLRKKLLAPLFEHQRLGLALPSCLFLPLFGLAHLLDLSEESASLVPVLRAQNHLVIPSFPCSKLVIHKALERLGLGHVRRGFAASLRAPGNELRSAGLLWTQTDESGHQRIEQPVAKLLDPFHANDAAIMRLNGPTGPQEPSKALHALCASPDIFPANAEHSGEFAISRTPFALFARRLLPIIAEQALVMHLAPNNAEGKEPMLVGVAAEASHVLRWPTGEQKSLRSRGGRRSHPSRCPALVRAEADASQRCSGSDLDRQNALQRMEAELPPRAARIAVRSHASTANPRRRSGVDQDSRQEPAKRKRIVLEAVLFSGVFQQGNYPGGSAELVGSRDIIDARGGQRGVCQHCFSHGHFAVNGAFVFTSESGHQQRFLLLQSLQSIATEAADEALEGKRSPRFRPHPMLVAAMEPPEAKQGVAPPGGNHVVSEHPHLPRCLPDEKRRIWPPTRHLRRRRSAGSPGHPEA
eukprot:scaffold485_cov272-Pinguiococcus_pyrenoidosus.AAC.6